MAVNISRKHSPYHKDVWRSVLSTDQEMIPVTNAKDVNAQYFLVNDEFRLSDLKTAAQCTRSLQATRTAWCSQSAGSSRTVCSSPVFGPVASRPPHCARHEYYYSRGSSHGLWLVGIPPRILNCSIDEGKYLGSRSGCLTLTHWLGRWVDFVAGLDAVEIVSASNRVRFPDYPASSLVTTLTELSRSSMNKEKIYNIDQ